MKRLVDESTDELTRSLLEAGRTHQPPSGNEAKLLLSLGVGGSVGLFSSKAFAWLGSGAGKLTLVGVGVGIAGVGYTLASPHSVFVGTPAAVEAPVSVETPLAGSVGTSAAPAPVAAPGLASSTVLPEHVLSERAALRPREAAAEGGTDPANAISAESSLPNAPLDRASGSRRHAHGRRGRIAVTSHHTLAALGSEAAPSLGSAATTNGATKLDGVASEAIAANSESGSAVSGRVESGRAVSGRSQPASSQPVAGGTVPGLDSEVALVDAMRSALARGDGAALHRLIESYRGFFPHGQLQAEVAELAARPLPSGH